MPSSKALGALRWLTRSANWTGTFEPSKQCLSKQSLRSMATEAEIPVGSTPLNSFATAHVASTAPPTNDIATPTWNPPSAIATLFDFPTMEPLKYLEYRHDHLLLPLRRDLLHRAVVYEGDKTRQGTASTKWRSEIRGSARKLRPQKGTGRARLGDRKSPMLRGGGVAFGPHPRDFSTELPRKVYDKAWRTALSYRYRRGQLIIVNDNIAMPKDTTTHYLKEIFDTHSWGKGFGRSSLITEVKKAKLWKSAAEISQDAKVLDLEDVDVKDLLETGRLVVEKKALDRMLEEHSSDIREPIAPILKV